MAFDVLLINAIVHILTFFYAYYRAKKFNLYVCIWLAYGIVTFMGYLCVVWNMHYIKDVDLGYKVNIMPYIYSYLTTLLLTYPFKKIGKIKFDFTILQSKKLFNLSLFLGVVFLFQTIVNGITAYIVVNTIGLGEAYMMGHEGESLNVFGSDFLNRIIHVSSVITSSFSAIYVVFYISRIISKKGKLINNVLLMSLAFLPNVMSALTSGSKGGLFFTAFGLIFYYMLFRSYFTEKQNRYIVILGAIVGVFFLYSVMAIVTSRIETATKADANEEQRQSHIVHYLGESYPNLGAFYYNQVKEHPYGRRFFPEFFDINPEDDYKYEGIYRKFFYWESKTGVPMGRFKTFWGDWYVEYGTYGSFIGIIIVFFFFKKMCFESFWRISSLPILYFYYIKIIIRGLFTGSGLEGTETHKALLVILIVSFVMKFYETRRRLSVHSMR